MVDLTTRIRKVSFNERQMVVNDTGDPLEIKVRKPDDVGSWVGWTEDRRTVTYFLSVLEAPNGDMSIGYARLVESGSLICVDSYWSSADRVP